MSLLLSKACQCTNCRHPCRPAGLMSSGPQAGHFLLPARLPSPFFGGALPLRRSLSNFIFFLHTATPLTRTSLTSRRPKPTRWLAKRTVRDPDRRTWDPAWKWAPGSSQLFCRPPASFEVLCGQIAGRSQCDSQISVILSPLGSPALEYSWCTQSSQLDAAGWCSSSGVATQPQYRQPVTCLHEYV